jgi:GT2 family glycosyltransferase
VIEIVSATRHSKTQFWAKTALGQSLKRLEFDQRIASRIAFENRRGLPEIYNERIQSPDSPEILVFIHDDVWLDDYWLSERLLEGLNRFDVLGVAGNRRRAPSQPGWFWIEEGVRDDVAHLSGAVAHGPNAGGEVVAFGFSASECELLDGVMLAARKSRLRELAVGFDPRFDFHFYDLDFCRTARQQGLRLGTWPIAITHQSGGRIDDRWRQALQLYRAKWGEV